MADALYQLEKAEGGEAFICLGGARMAQIPAAKAEALCGAVERIEGQRGQQIALRFLTIGISLAAPSPPKGRGEEGRRVS